MAQVGLQLGPNLVQNLQNFRSVMVKASGVLFWVPIAVFVSIEHLRGNFYTLTRILLPLLIFYFFVYFIKSYYVKTALIFAIYIAFYLSLYFFGHEIVTVAIPFGIIFLSGILLLCFGLDIRFSIPGLILILILEYLVATTVGDKLILSGAAYNIYLFIIFHAIIGLVAMSFVYVLQKELTFIDQETFLFAKKNQVSEAILLQRDLVRNIKNKIHGTLLNNLSLIAQKRFSARDVKFVEKLRNDLSSSAEIEGSIGDRSLGQIIDEVLANTPLVKTQLELTQVPDQILPKQLAIELQEVLFEVLRNIDNHAAASLVKLQIQIQKNHLTLTLEDDGIGPLQIQSSRFGVKSAILETLKSVGGQISYSFRKPEGTITKILFPLTESLSLKNLSRENILRRIFSKQLISLLFAPHFILFVFFLTDPLARSNPIILILHFFVFLFLGLSLFPDIARINPVFPTLYLLFSMIFIWELSKIYNSPEVAGAWNWILNPLNISFVFYIAYQRNTILRWLGHPTLFLFTLFTMQNIPRELHEAIYPPLLNGMAAGIAFGSAIVVFYLKIKKKITLYEKNYRTENLERANEELSRRTISGWKINPEAGISIISEAITCPDLIKSAEFVRKAQIEQARLRSLLSVDPTIESNLNLQIIKVINSASFSENIFELEFHGSQERNPSVPDMYFDLVRALVEVKQNNPIQAKIFSSDNQIQISLVADRSVYDAIAANIEFDEPQSSRWTLDTEEIVEDNQEKIWFMISTQRTSDELAHYAQTSNTQKAIRLH